MRRSNKRPTIVLDTQGGDREPSQIVAGGWRAMHKHGINVVFAGDQQMIRKELSRRARRRARIIDASETITMEDVPTVAVRRKTQSSLVRGIEAVRQGEADGFVSPANTGAVMAASLLKLGRIRGIERPGISAIISTVNQRKVLIIDVGANVDCNPNNLKEFAIMGAVYAREVLDIPSPKIGLLNIGSERSKGNGLALKTFFLLEQLGNFAGNVEGNQILEGQVDVVVCDGFVGNVLLKSYEGGASATVEFLRMAIERNFLARLGAFILLPALKNFKRTLSAARYGGAPLLGVKRVVVVAHGNSDAEAISNAVRVAAESVRNELISKIERGLAGEVSPVRRREITA